ncbi:hypothetical protein AZOA_39810 [Azoarcus sp. Aa7]|nr:hypothetical protein [Azoarcus sp. Aa7]
MTTFRLDESAGPGTHVFVIGVGAYPRLKGGTGPLNPMHRDLGQLTSPPISATAMLRWVDTTLNNPDAPLKSIEVLISQPDPATYTDADGLSQQIDAATWDNFELAVKAWFDRADRHPQNVAIFYFCGHGLGDGVDTHLLMGDAGASHELLRHALHVNAFRLAMGACAAQKQIYFVDACRTVDLATVLNPNFPAQSGLPAANVLQVFNGANPVLHSARKGEPAFGNPGEVSDFTKALLEGLTRCAVFQPFGHYWAVSPQELQKAVAALMDDYSGKPQCQADGLSGVGFQLHRLTGSPDVVVHVSLDKDQANDSAEISYTAIGQTVIRPNKAHPWRTFVPYGQCSVQAQFAPPSTFTAKPIHTFLVPPFQNIMLEVL